MRVEIYIDSKDHIYNPPIFEGEMEILPEVNDFVKLTYTSYRVIGRCFLPNENIVQILVED